MSVRRAGILSGLFGGVLSGITTFVLINGNTKNVWQPATSDAISIANTYIVFTTIIFVATTIFLAVAGIWFTHQFASTKEAQTTNLMSEIEQRLRENKDDCGIKFIEKVINNPDVSRHIQNKIDEKIQQILEEKRNAADNASGVFSALKGKISTGKE